MLADQDTELHSRIYRTEEVSGPLKRQNFEKKCVVALLINIKRL